MTTQFISAATEVFSAIDKRSMFIVIHNYKNNFNEVATFSLCWHIDYIKAVKKSYDLLHKFHPSIAFCIGKPYTMFDLEAAYNELLSSLADTLLLGPGNNPLYTNKGVYDDLVDFSGSKISGIKIHKRNQEIHLTDVYRINKIIHKPGIYPKTISSRKTVAKNDLRQMTPLKKWGQFVLSPGRFSNMTVNKISIKEEDMIRKWAI